MKQTRLMILMAAGAVALLGGCSGAGAPAGELRGTALHSIATDNLSAVALVSSWVQILYQKSSGQMSIPVRTIMPDGSLRFTGTNSDGSTYAYFIADPNVQSSPGRGTITWPDGTRFSQEWEADVVSADRKHVTSQIRQTYPNGASLQCRTVVDYSDTSSSTEQREGTATTAAHATMRFTLRRVDTQDVLELALPDGSRVTLTVPLRPVAGVNYWPRFQEPTMGQFTAADGSVLEFKLTGATDDAWNRWELTAAGGTTGAFNLGAGLAGSGQLLQAGQVVGALGWAAGGQGTLDLLGEGQQGATPSAAARDFQITNWARNAACLGPMPMY